MTIRAQAGNALGQESHKTWEVGAHTESRTSVWKQLLKPRQRLAHQRQPVFVPAGRS